MCVATFERACLRCGTLRHVPFGRTAQYSLYGTQAGSIDRLHNPVHCLQGLIDPDLILPIGIGEGCYDAPQMPLLQHIDHQALFLSTAFLILENSQAPIAWTCYKKLDTELLLSGRYLIE